VDLDGLLARMPHLRAMAATGEKAAGVIAALTDTAAPKMGEKTRWEERGIDIWRMPSTSRAYPLSLDKKAACYRRLFNK